jgi:fumarate hydratase subunit alpha
VPGDRLKISFLPKGCGSENMSALKMLPPSSGIDGVIEFVTQSVVSAGSNPCPPVIVGVGVGGTFEKAALLAKKALLRPVGQPSEREDVVALEERLLTEINKKGQGVHGLGGNNTALAVHVDIFPSHIASLPVAVNIQCHAHRHKDTVL